MRADIFDKITLTEIAVTSLFFRIFYKFAIADQLPLKQGLKQDIVRESGGAVVPKDGRYDIITSQYAVFTK